jgi:hypothetical protein
MTTRASTTAAAGDSNASKRRRVEHDTLSRDTVSLDNVNEHCLIEILRFLEAEDLNSFAMCSRRCREARSSPTLDQTRTGTIICVPGSSIPRIYNAISRGGWNNELYSGNRTRLRVVDFDEFTCGFSRMLPPNDDLFLPGITSLDLSCSHPNRFGRILHPRSYCLARVLPNLRELDLSYMFAISSDPIGAFFYNCPLTRLTWNSGNCNLFLDEYGPRIADNLAEIYMDGAEFEYHCPNFYQQQHFEEEPNNGRRSYYMFMRCKCLERVSIKNTRFVPFDREHEARPVSQGMIMKFVRHTPTLRWLRSDLTEENVVILQQERPDVTFVMD